MVFLGATKLPTVDHLKSDTIPHISPNYSIRLQHNDYFFIYIHFYPKHFELVDDDTSN